MPKSLLSNVVELNSIYLFAITTAEPKADLTKTERNTYIADIPNAQLRFPSGNSFRQDNPVAGITAVTVTNQALNSIQVTVTSASGVPTVK